MNEKYTEYASKWFELSNDTYRTYIKSLIWGQERALEVTRTLIGQSEKIQKEGKGLVQEFTREATTARKFWQGAWQETARNSVEVLNQYRAAANTGISEMNQDLDALQHRIEAASKA